MRSGGSPEGAVYHDLGNLNFSFIVPNSGGNFHNFRKFTAPIIQVLNDIGVPAEYGGRSDILVKGRKISGNAQYNAGERMISHGTLLYETELNHVDEVLKAKSSRIESKGIKSIHSQVANIVQFLDNPPAIEGFRQLLLEGILGNQQPIRQYHLGEADWDGIHMLSVDRYQTWEWNYGRSPTFNIQKRHHFSCGEIDVHLCVAKGIIEQLKFYGDFFSQGEVGELETLLPGKRYEGSTLLALLKTIDLGYYFKDLSADELVWLLY